MRDRPRSLLFGRRAWHVALLALLLQIAAPVLALDAMADHLAVSPICGGDGAPSHPADGLCPACQFCAAVQPVVAPAPLAAPLPNELKPWRRVGLADVAVVGASAIIAKARSPPVAANDTA